jgi:hypothetical protein
MTVENTAPATTESESAKESTKTPTRGRKPKEDSEVTALSVSSAKSGGLHLMKSPTGLPGNRPIEASHLHIIGTYSAVGGSRPITTNGIEVSSTMTISGNRPIAVSHLAISEMYSVMGNRPVASNQIDDPTALMGFLD